MFIRANRAILSLLSDWASHLSLENDLMASCAGANPKGQPGYSLSALVDIFTGVHKVSRSQPGT